MPAMAVCQGQQLGAIAGKPAPTGGAIFLAQLYGANHRWSLQPWFVPVFFYSQLKGYLQESWDRDSLALGG